MNKKILLSIISMITVISLLFSTVAYAATKDEVTLEKVDDTVCTIDFNGEGKLTKKLLSVDNDNKEVILQIDVENTKQAEETIRPSEVFLVLDNSGSMNQNPFGNGKTRKEAVFEAAKTLANKMLEAQSSTKIGVVSFSTTTTFSATGSLQDATLQLMPTSDISAINNAIDGIELSGALTDIDAGLQVARDNFSSDNSLNKYLILLTDGVPNVSVGGPSQIYSGETATNTRATLQSVKDKGINIITVMTGVSATYQPDAEGNSSAEAKGKTYLDLATEIFGSSSNPTYGKFYFVSDENAENTITEEVYRDTVVVSETSLRNITVVDYFPDDIIANYDFSIVEQANIGNVSAVVDEENNSITWYIEKLDAGQVASFKYKLKLKDSFDSNIIDKVTPTNKKVDVTYTDTNGDEQIKTSTDSPSVILKGIKKDVTVAPTPIPQTGEKAITSVMILVSAVVVGTIIYKYRKISK